jgi:hypothetical protein
VVKRNFTVKNEQEKMSMKIHHNRKKISHKASLACLLAFTFLGLGCSRQSLPHGGLFIEHNPYSKKLVNETLIEVVDCTNGEKIVGAGILIKKNGEYQPVSINKASVKLPLFSKKTQIRVAMVGYLHNHFVIMRPKKGEIAKIICCLVPDGEPLTESKKAKE